MTETSSTHYSRPLAEVADTLHQRGFLTDTFGRRGDFKITTKTLKGKLNWHYRIGVTQGGKEFIGDPELMSEERSQPVAADADPKAWDAFLDDVAQKHSAKCNALLSYLATAEPETTTRSKTALIALAVLATLSIGGALFFVLRPQPLPSPESRVTVTPPEQPVPVAPTQAPPERPPVQATVPPVSTPSLPVVRPPLQSQPPPVQATPATPAQTAPSVSRPPPVQATPATPAPPSAPSDITEIKKGILETLGAPRPSAPQPTTSPQPAPPQAPASEASKNTPPKLSPEQIKKCFTLGNC